MELNDLFQKLPVNARSLLEGMFGGKGNAPITADYFSPEQQGMLREMFLKKKAYNEAQPANIAAETMTRDEYARQPHRENRPDNPNAVWGKDKVTYSSQPVPYEEYAMDRQKMVDSYSKNPNKHSLSYEDFPIKAKDARQDIHIDDNWLTAAYRSLTDPAYAMKTTLGNFNMYDEGDKLRVQDTMDFDKDWWYHSRSAPNSELVQRYGGRPGSLFDAILSRENVKKEKTFSRPIDFTIPK
jgi:hypothetical protein